MKRREAPSPPVPPSAGPVPPPRPWGGWPLVRPVSSGRIWAWGVVYCLILGPVVGLVPQMSGNVSSRYATIEAIAERGTLAVDRSSILRQSRSPDVVKFGGHSYSDKPPVLPALASPIYLTLLTAGVQMTASPGQFLICNFALTWLITTFASGLVLVALRALLQGVAIPRWAADLATVAFGLASPLLSYAVTFNNHSVAAGCVISAWALTLLARPTRGGGKVPFAVGLLAGLAATIDLPVGGLTLAGLGLIMLARGGRAPLGFVGGALGPLLLHAGLQSLVTGTPLPTEMYPAAFEYPGSYWTTPEGRWRDPHPRWRFGLDFLVGRQGAFTVYPVLWFGVAGLLSATCRRHHQGRSERPAAAIVGGTFLILVAYYIWGVRRTDFAGSSYGCRHLLAITPLVYLFAIDGVSRARPRWLILGLLTVALGVGGIYSVIGATDPWTRVEVRARINPWLRVLGRGVLYPGGTFRGEHPTPPLDKGKR